MEMFRGNTICCSLHITNRFTTPFFSESPLHRDVVHELHDIDLHIVVTLSKYRRNHATTSCWFVLKQLLLRLGLNEEMNKFNI